MVAIFFSRCFQFSSATGGEKSHFLSWRTQGEGAVEDGGGFGVVEVGAEVAYSFELEAIAGIANYKIHWLTPVLEFKIHIIRSLSSKRNPSFAKTASGTGLYFLYLKLPITLRSSDE